MNARKNFDLRYVNEQLRRVSDEIVGKTTIYVAGGTVMAIENLKEGTKDIDVVVESAEDLRRLKKALTDSGYSNPTQSLEVAYKKMRAQTILENKDRFRWDIFERVIARKFQLSPGMKTRAREHPLSNEKVAIKLLSMEDVFLMKSVTEREGDLEDMAKIAQKGVNWDIIVTECDWQTKQTGRIWENSVCQSLEDLRVKYGITSPVESKICRAAEKKILAIEKQRHVN
jgi:hypothetical protein